MVLSLIGAALGAAGSIAGSVLGKSGGYDKWDHVRWQAEHDLNFKALARNVEMQHQAMAMAQREQNYGQNRWYSEYKRDDRRWAAEFERADPAWQLERTVNAAKESGIHPLAALGGTGGYSPVQGSGMSSGGFGGPPAVGGMSGGGHTSPMGNSSSGLGDAVGSGLAGLGEMVAMVSEEEKAKNAKKLTNAEVRKKNAETELINATSRTRIQQARNNGNEVPGTMSIGSYTGKTAPGTTNPEVAQKFFGEGGEAVTSTIHTAHALYGIANDYFEKNMGYSPRQAKKAIEQATGLDTDKWLSGQYQMQTIKKATEELVKAGQRVRQQKYQGHQSKRY